MIFFRLTIILNDQLILQKTKEVYLAHTGLILKLSDQPAFPDILSGTARNSDIDHIENVNNAQ